MADLGSTQPLQSGPPFADWREQLRERVREIRARKMAADRRRRSEHRAEDAAAAATAEKLRIAREAARAAEASAAAALGGEPDGPAATSPIASDEASAPAQATPPGAGRESTLPAPAATFLPNGASRAQRRDEVTAVGDDLLQVPADAADPGDGSGTSAPPAEVGSGSEGFEDGAAGAPVADPGISAPDAAAQEAASGLEAHERSAAPQDAAAEEEIPLFQEEPTFFDEEAQPATVFEGSEASAESAESPAESAESPAESAEGPADSAESPAGSAEGPAERGETAAEHGGQEPSPDAPEPPAWARVTPAAPDATPPRAPTSAAPPDVDAIPPDMKDVQIPAWALPRRSDTPSAEPTPETPARAAADRPTPSGSPSVAPSVPEDVYLVGEFVSTPPRARIAELAAETKLAAEQEATTATDPAGRAANAAPAAAPPEQDARTTPGPAAADEPSSATAATVHVSPVPRGFFDAPATHEHARAAAATDDAALPDPEQAGAARTPGRRIPGLFDTGGPNAAARRRTSPTDSPEETLSPAGESTSAVPGQPPRAASAPATPSSDPRALEWDLDAPADPETILEAQRDPLDPSAPIADRVFSALADALVLLAIGLLLAGAAARAAESDLLSVIAAAPGPFVGVWALFAFVYAVFFVGTCGQTLGKMAMRVRVIGTRRFRVGYARAARRALYYLLAILPAFLGLVPALRGPEHRALHDRWSGTRVVKA